MERAADELRGTSDPEQGSERSVTRPSAAAGFNISAAASRPNRARGARGFAPINTQPAGFYDEAASLAAQVGHAAAPARHAAIYLVQSGAVTCIATSSGGDAEGRGPAAVSDHPHVKQALEGDAIVVDAAPGRTGRSLATAGGVAVAAIPVHTDGLVVGVLEVEGAPDDFDDRHIAQLLTLANLIGAGLAMTRP